MIRDGTAIIEHFEAALGRPSRPTGPKQRIISALFDVIGTDGLLRPAMHYRWNFPEDNLAFVRYHLLHSQRDTPERSEKTEAMMNRMRHVAMIFGVTEQSQGAVESLYLDYLEALNAHLEHYPYLLGWRPSIGDFGLIAPMYAHLGRDPHPATLMQQQAVSVHRWVERMNPYDQDVPEFFNAGTDFVEDYEIPKSLMAVLRVLAEDFVPETLAAADVINGWLAENHPGAGAPAVGRLAQAPGTASFVLRGETIEALAQPHRFHLLQRVQDDYVSLSETDKVGVDAVLGQSAMGAILEEILSRRIERANNLEVWA